MSLFNRSPEQSQVSNVRKFGTAVLVAAGFGAGIFGIKALSNDTPVTPRIETTTTSTAPSTTTTTEKIAVDIGGAVVTQEQNGPDASGNSNDIPRYGDTSTTTQEAVVGGDPTQVTNPNPVQIGGGADTSIERLPVNPAG